MKLYNSLTKTIEPFVALKADKVGVYFCGPTVWDFVHIGNLRAATVNDLLVKTLRALKFNVTSVVNFTDVDDKIINALPKSSKTLKEFTQFFVDAYLKDLTTLGIKLPDIMPKATEHIPEMIALIEMLLANGHAYKAPNGDVYFKVAACANYGAIINLDPTKLRSNADGRLSSADNYEKENAQDFALWKAYTAADGDVFWESPFGKGRPGWHIECSAMATKYLGRTFDIHGGGIDLLFPHHTNEIAQSECGYGCLFARYWVHNAHLMVNGKKMSKSLSNFFTLRDLLAKGHAPLAIRYELLKSHYRDTLDFREDNFSANLSVIKKFQDFALDMQRAAQGVDCTGIQPLPAYDNFLVALSEDLNIQNALTIVHEFLSQTRATASLSPTALSPAAAAQALVTIKAFDGILGLFFANEKPKDLSAELQALLDARVAARAKKDFTRSDELRDELLAKRIAVKDGKTGQSWSWV